MTLFMETTEISPEKTVSQIETVLIRYGTSAVLKEYLCGEVVAVSFKSVASGREIPFRLPCRWEALAKAFRKRAEISDWAWDNTAPYYASRRKKIEDKAKRVAWRQILRWVEAQMALVETSMVDLEEVFFPYIITKTNQTVYEINQPKMALLLGEAREGA